MHNDIINTRCNGRLYEPAESAACKLRRCIPHALDMSREENIVIKSDDKEKKTLHKDI